MKKLLKDIRDNDILLEVVDGELHVFANGSEDLSQELIAEIKERRRELIQFLLSNDQAGFDDSFQLNIPVAPAGPHYPLTSAQRRLWVLSQFEAANAAYNMPGVYLLEGNLDRQALLYSFNSLIARHEILRTIFKEDEDSDVRQYIRPAQELDFSIPYVDLRQDPEKVRAFIQEGLSVHFELSTGPLLRAGLCQIEDNKWVLTYAMHHITGDGWSVAILIRELLLFYHAYVKGEGDPLSPLRIQYKDYAVWQRQQLTGDALQVHKAYWLTQFSDELPVLQLPGDKPRLPVKTYNGEVIERVIDRHVVKGIKTLSQERNSSLFMALLAAVNTLLFRYTGQEDIIIGTPVVDREHLDLEGQIGLYLNTLAIRAQFSGDDTFTALLAHIRQVTLEAYEHQAYPFDELIEGLGIQRDMSRNPLFDVMVVLQNNEVYDVKQQSALGGLRVSEYGWREHVISKFDLTFTFEESGDTLKTTVEYNSDIYHKDTVSRLVDHLERLLAAIVQQPAVPIGKLRYLSESEVQQLLFGFNDTAIAYPANETIVDLFAEQVAKTPGNIAVEFEKRKLTYKELDELSTRLGGYLSSNYAIQPEDRIAVMLDRSDNLIIAILAILRSGGAYVPIDPDYPEARKAFIIKDTGCKALITQSDYIFDLTYYDGPIFAIDLQLDEIDSILVEPRDAGIRPDNLAYVMYTSGSMGIPKGVMVDHRGVVRLVKSDNYVQLTGREALLSTGAISFDATTFEYWGMLLNGGRLVLCGKAVLLDGKQLSTVIQEKKVDTMWFTAGWLNQLVDGELEVFSGLRTVLAGGDKLSPVHIHALLSRYPDLKIINGYGPTENTTFSLTYPVTDAGGNIPVGKPISNSTAYIVDDRRQLLPIGAVGEICVGGDGLAKGYLNNPELTAEKFIAHPFSTGERVYRTGDRGRWLPDGNIEFMGRVDDQVKVRGYRIELAEIENCLNGHPEIDSAVVITRADHSGDKELLAYITAKESLAFAEIRAYVGRLLPGYMIPDHFVRLEKLPLTPNGKVDRRQLPDPAGSTLSVDTAYIAPRNKTEEKLASIWQEILGREKISVKDDFFEIGGHSLKATRLASQIHKEFDVRLSFNELFSKTVLEDQALSIVQATRTAFAAIAPAAEEADYPLSSAQRRLWVLSQFEEGSIAYNIPAVYLLEGDLDAGAMGHAFDALIARHEILRTVFKEDEQGEVRQFILSPERSGFHIVHHDLRREKEKLKHWVEAEAVRPFDLGNGPLLRASLFQLEDNAWVFAYTMHHIISDGWSMGILIKELSALYNTYGQAGGYPMPPLRIQYKDYAVWQQGQLMGDRLQEHKDFWLGQFEGELPVLSLPADKPRPLVKTYNGGIVTKRIRPDLSKGMHDLCREQGATLFMGLLAAVNALVYQYTGQDDIVIGSPIAGREHADLEDQIGFYVNTLALRTRFKGKDSYRELLENVKDNTLAAYQHQVYPFDELIEDLQLRRDMSRNALFDVMVVLQNNETNSRKEQPALHKLSISRYEEVAALLSKVDLSFDFVEKGEELYADIEYNSDIYHEATIERLADHLEQILEAIIAHPSMSVRQLDYLSADEKQELLLSFSGVSTGHTEDRTIIELFEMQVQKTPDNIAILFDDVHISYRELNAQANRLAGYLRTNYQIKADEVVGISLDRSEWLIITILAVLKSGGAYLPMDKEYPKERIGYMAEDSHCKVIIDEAGLAVFSAVASDYAEKNPERVSKIRDLAYVIYTSGTTGSPKGVMIEHRSLADYSMTFGNKFNVQERDRVIQQSSISFDTHVEEIYPALIRGGCILMGRNGGRDVYELKNLIEERNATILSATPLILRELNSINVALNALRLLISGGDIFKPSYVSGFIGRLPIYDTYGPSEATVCCTCYKIEDAGEDPVIGRPLHNRSIFILNREQSLQPIGVAGEICVGGSGLARGYLNQPGITTEKFVPNPYRHGELMYKTGDFGRWLPDGNIQFTGRKDEQVKIRGYRIELGEIENALREYADIDSAVVLARKNMVGEKELVAYLVGKEPLHTSQIRTFLGRTLPGYMVPAHFVQLERIPLTPNGKVDRKSLPDPEGPELSTGIGYEAPRNATEERLVSIWQEILGRERIGVKDNFFELGGHSLKATRLASQLHKEFDVKLALKELFTSTVLEEQAQLIDQAKKTLFTAVAPVGNRSHYQLSSAQRRLWVLSQFEEQNIAYNIPGVHILEGDLHMEAMEQAFDALIERHEILRTIFTEDELGEIRQFILPPGETGFRIACRDIRPETAADRKEEINDLIHAAFLRPFDLSSGPLLRADLYRATDTQWIFVFVMHHIISDGWSMDILIRELLVLYTAFSHKMSNPLLPLRIQYKDYATWQQEQLNGEALKHHKAYWLKRFGDKLPVLELVGDRARPAIKSFNGGVISSRINPMLNKGLKAICQQGGGTLFMGLLAAVNTLLYRYTGQEDIIIGSPIAGREHADLEGQVGCYINTLAIRTQFSGNDTYKELLENIRQVTLSAYEHQAYPFDELVGELHLQREMSRSAIFDVMVVLQNTGSQKLEGLAVEGIRVGRYEGVKEVVSQFDLSFIFEEWDEELQVRIEYNSDIHDKNTIVRLAVHLEQLLRIIIENPLMPISRLDYLSEVEKQELLVSFNDAETEYPDDRTIVGLFEEQAARTPDRIALVFEDTRLTYRELNERSNQLAAYLRTKHTIEPDDLIGIRLGRSEWLVTVILAVLKSGGAYVPIDPEYPSDRLAHILADSHCKTLIDEEELTRIREACKTYSRDNLVPVSKPEDLAYVIYTSGSTGKPKGVMIIHRAVVNLVVAQKAAFAIGCGENVLQFSNVSFDASVEQIFIALTSGACLTMVDKETASDPEKLEHFIDEQRITHIHMVPGILKMLNARKYESLQRVIAGGDRCPKDLAERWGRYHTFYNEYGPTETTITSIELLYEQDNGASEAALAIGRPIANTSVYILQEDQLLPVGVVGEICVGGAGLARGYLNNPVLTMERFVCHPFKPGARIYRTGDLGRWLPDGNIEFIGRKDDQVKIRGYRIELGEIEHALRGYPGLESGVVAAIPGQHGEKELAAYTVSKRPLNISEVRAYLSRTLPAYMVPGYFIELDALPLNHNGKVDRKALPDPVNLGLSSTADYAAPRNQMEERLVSIWQEVLGNRRVGVKDDFFELGGHSLKATRLASKIHKEFDVKLTLKELFSATVLEEQSRLIDRAKKISFTPIMPVAAGADHPLSSSQRRLWILSQFEGGNIAYNMPGVYALEGRLDRDALEDAFSALIERHEILRTVFKEGGEGSIRQFIHSREESGFEVVYRDLRDRGREEQLAVEISAEAERPFDLAMGPLLRTTLFKVEDDQWILAYTMHHIISDGWSMGILIKELLVLYNAYSRGEDNPLAPLRIQYKDYAAWQQEQLGGDDVDGGVLAEQKRYWLRQFEGELPVLQLPTDKARPAVKTYKGGAINRKLSPELVKGIKELSREQKGTLFIGLLGVVNTLLFRYTGQTDIIIGTPIAGREHADLDNQIGFYVNTLALRTQFKGEDNYKELLKRIRQITLDAYRHQAYPFDELVGDLQLQRDMSRNALFDVMVVLQNMRTHKEKEEEDPEGLKVQAYGQEEHVSSKFDLLFNFVEIGEGLQVSIEYNSDVFHEGTAERLADHLEQLMAVIIQRPGVPIFQLDYLGKNEKQELLHWFNDTEAAYPENETVIDLFEQQVEKTPEAIALVFQDKQLTYRELNARTNQFARYIRAQTIVGPGICIGVMLDRSEWSVISMIGIMKLGAAYVPIDPSLPISRIRYILEQSRSVALVAARSTAASLVDLPEDLPLIDPDLIPEGIDPANLRLDIAQTDASFIIYTSGSTGDPKGVEQTHKTLYNLILWDIHGARMETGTRHLQFSSFSFDSSLHDVYYALATGGEVHVINELLRRDLWSLKDYILDNGISTLSMPYAALKAMFSEIAYEKFEGHRIREIISTGEQLYITGGLRQFLQNNPSVKIYNLYGPSETHVVTGIAYSFLSGGVPEKAGIGEPIHNTVIYILDKEKQLVPIGVEGELYAGGWNLARGYTGRPDLTAEKFITDPFRKDELVYKTGDIAKWLPDGGIEYMMRQDNQVKINGYRIELGEIEGVLRNYEMVEEAIVMVKGSKDGDLLLVAYLVSKIALNVGQLRNGLKKFLPAYMIPTYFVQLEKMPLTRNGKTDTRALPDPEELSMATGNEYVGPRNIVESKLVSIWGDVLKIGTEKIGIKDNFFELGGHSLKATRLVSQIQKEFGVRVALKDVFMESTIEGMALGLDTLLWVKQNESVEKSDANIETTLF